MLAESNKTDLGQEKGLGEPDAHLMMRRAKTILRPLLIVTVLATIALLLVFPQAAFLAAFPVPVLVLVYMYVGYLERRSRAGRLRTPNQAGISQDEVETDVRYAGILTTLFLAVLLVLSTVVIAATLVEDWSMVGLLASVILLLAILIMFPYFPLFVSGSRSEERERLMKK
jgi:hypothetical protein